MADTDKLSGLPSEWESGYVPTVLHFKDGNLEDCYAGSDWRKMAAFAATPSRGGGGGGYIHTDWCNGSCQNSCNPDGQLSIELEKDLRRVEGARLADAFTYVEGYLPGSNNLPGMQGKTMTLEEAMKVSLENDSPGLTWSGDRTPDGPIQIWVKNSSCSTRCGGGAGSGWHSLIKK